MEQEPRKSERTSWQQMLSPWLMAGAAAFLPWLMLRKERDRDLDYETLLADERLESKRRALFDTERRLHLALGRLDAENMAVTTERRHFATQDLERIEDALDRHRAALESCGRAVRAYLAAFEVIMGESRLLVREELERREQRDAPEPTNGASEDDDKSLLDLLDEQESGARTYTDLNDTFDQVGANLRKTSERLRANLTDREREILDTRFNTTPLPAPYDEWPVGTAFKIVADVADRERKYNRAIDLTPGEMGIVIAPASSTDWPDDAVEVLLYNSGGRGALDVAVLEKVPTEHKR